MTLSKALEFMKHLTTTAVKAIAFIVLPSRFQNLDYYQFIVGGPTQKKRQLLMI